LREGDSMTWETLSGETRRLTVVAVREAGFPDATPPGRLELL
jgi:hypothetical protein